MSEWKKVKLGEITQIIDGDRGKNYPKNNEFSNVGYCLFLNTGNVTKEGFTFENNQFISKEKDNLLRKGKIQRGDLILTTRGTVGNIGFYDNHIKYDNIRINSGMVILRVIKDIVDAQFLYQLIRGNECRTYIKSFCTGSAQPQLPIKNLSQIDIKIPHLLTQYRIATILSRYDSLIENYQKQIKLLEEAAQRLYKEWFVDLHFPGHENTKIVDGVPEGWEKKTLGELISYVRGKSYSSNEISDEGCIMVNLKNIQAFGGYKRDAEKRFIGEYKPEQTLQKGDLVMGVTDMTQERRLVGHVALIPDFNEPATFSMDLIKIIPYSIPIIYLYCAMRYGGISKQISPLANGVNVLHLKPDTIMGTMMLVPRKDLIERFCPFVEEMVNKILKNQSQIRLLTEARDRLLPKLMSGEIEV